VPTLSPSVQRVVDVAARKGVELEIVTFDDSTHTAADAARALEAEVGQIVKSLVFVIDRDSGPEGCLVLVSGANTVDLARLAAVLTESRLRRASAEEARTLTGFAIGGIPPFGHAAQLRTVMDPDLGRFETVWAAAGTPHAVFRVAPGTLRMLANAIVAPLARDGAAPSISQMPHEAAPASAAIEA
jgi:prolyl-tRNA editing enzyme YbaK/EbsC (Cys-tRNA(Pro) deacylase)